MNPRDEFMDLVARSRKFYNAALLLLITLGAMVVAGGTLLFAVWITMFVFVRGIADRMTSRVTSQKMEMLNVL